MNHDWKLRYLLYFRIDKITKTVWMSVLVRQLILFKKKRNHIQHNSQTRINVAAETYYESNSHSELWSVGTCCHVV